MHQQTLMARARPRDCGASDASWRDLVRRYYHAGRGAIDVDNSGELDRM